MIDWNLFRSNLEPHPQEVVDEVIGTFIAAYPGDRMHLQRAIEIRNWPDITRHAHDVKTNCLWVGATEAAGYALRIENMGKQLEEERFDEIFPLMDKAVEVVLSELSGYLRNR